jgi:spermidine/putrescine transport system substrate-binding protein
MTEGLRILASEHAARTLSRRAFLGGSLAAVGGMALLAGCSTKGKGGGGTAAGLESKLNIYTWGDYDDPDVIKDFTKSFGPKVTMDSFGSNEEMVAKLAAAKGTSGYDIIVPTGPFIQQLAAGDLVERLDHSKLPNLKNVDPVFLDQEWDKGNVYSVPKAWGTTGYVYDKTKISREMSTWQDFIDVAMGEASGRTSVLDDPSDVLGIYMWANGIDWNTTDSAELDACEDFLVNKFAKHIKAFDSYPGAEAIPQGQHALMQVWNGDARLGIMESDDPDKWVWVLGGPKTELWMDNWAIAKGAPHPEAAHAFINHVLDPEISLRELAYIGYHTGVKDIEDAARAEGLESLEMVFFTPEELDTMTIGLLTESQERRVDIWNKMKAKAGA